MNNNKNMSSSDFENIPDNQSETGEKSENNSTETRGENGRLCQWDVGDREKTDEQSKKTKVIGSDWDDDVLNNETNAKEKNKEVEQENKKYGLNISELDDIIDSEDYKHRVSRATGKVGEELNTVRKDAKKVVRVLAQRYGSLHGYKYEAEKSQENLDYTDNDTRVKVTDSIKNDFLKHIKSDAYRDKLAKGFDDEEKATEEQSARIQLLEQVKIYPNVERGSEKVAAIVENMVKSIPQYKEASPEEQKKIMESQQRRYKSTGVQGFYNPDEKAVYVFDDQNTKQRFEGVMQHELGHVATDGNSRLLERDKDILGGSFNVKINNNFTVDKNRNEYLSDPTEQQTRKAKLDKRLESLGIKRYDEEFTKDHFDMIQILNKMRIFDEDEQDFIDTTEPDLETYKKIFDTIATTDDTRQNKEEKFA